MEKKLRKYLPNGDFKGVSQQRSRAMAAVKGAGNKTTELRFRYALVRRAIQGWKVRPQSIRGKPDFLFPKYHVAIFVDGCFWHGCLKCGHYPKTNSAFWKAKIDRNRQRDRETTEYLKENGFYVLRFWEHEIAQEIDLCVTRLMSILEGRDTD